MGSGIAMSYIPWSYYRMKPLGNRKVVRVTNIYDIVTLNPFQTPEINNSTMLRWMYPTFVIRAPDTTVQPWAAEKWSVPEPTKVDLVLRDGMKFDDGKPVTVEDVKFTFDYILQWKFPALARVTDSVESVEIKGPREVRFNLKKPSASFVPSVLGFAFIAPKHIWEGVPGSSGLKSPADWPNEKPVGYGAFRFKEWRKGEYLHFDVNKGFFTPPNIDGVIWLVVPNIENQLAMMERGEADLIGWTIDAEQAKRLRAHKDLTVVTVPSHGLHEARFNMEMAPTNDPKFRLALQHAINRPELIDVVFGGLDHAFG
jgi:peptide/nickel transport system substrate-binding protein